MWKDTYPMVIEAWALYLHVLVWKVFNTLVDPLNVSVCEVFILRAWQHYRTRSYSDTFVLNNKIPEQKSRSEISRDHSDGHSCPKTFHCSRVAAASWGDLDWSKRVYTPEQVNRVQEYQDSLLNNGQLTNGALISNYSVLSVTTGCEQKQKLMCKLISNKRDGSGPVQVLRISSTFWQFKSIEHIIIMALIMIHMKV